MKTRQELVEGLQWILDSHAAACGPAGDVSEFIEPAIEMLRVPDSAEITVTRSCVEQWVPFVGEYSVARLLRALDALAREPGLEAELRDLDNANRGLGTTIESLRGTALTLTSQNIALEARLAKVHEIIGVEPEDAVLTEVGRLLSLCSRLEVAEAKLARVREEVRAWRHWADHAGPPCDDTARGFSDTIDAALADEAAPKVKP